MTGNPKHLSVTKLTHELVLGIVHRNTLKRIDIMVWTNWKMQMQFSMQRWRMAALASQKPVPEFHFRTKQDFEKLLSNKKAIYRDTMNMNSFRSTARPLCRMETGVCYWGAPSEGKTSENLSWWPGACYGGGGQGQPLMVEITQHSDYNGHFNSKGPEDGRYLES